MISAFEEFINYVDHKNPNEPEFLQAVTEVFEDLVPYLIKYQSKLHKSKILERIIEPERTITFRVTWLDDKNEVQVNRGYRVQMNSAIGPYKGGLRFSPTVNLSVLKFLAFEQIFKNSLTGIPMGAAKGGADFDPKGRSDHEIMRFCQSFMTEMYRHIGPQTDIPAGDIGVGSREIGYLFGQYKRLQNDFTGVLTGKGKDWGGSLIRPEATGYGLLYFVKCILSTMNRTMVGQRVCISGAGNVAYYAAEKAIEMGGIVLTLSNSCGTLYEPNGFNREQLKHIALLGRHLEKYVLTYPGATFHKNKNPWGYKCDIALPCATENEIQKDDALELIRNGCYCVAEGANMPSSREAIQLFHNARLMFAPGKAANAGGVAVSGLEMSQNAIGQQWGKETVDNHLHAIMRDIFETCVKYGKEDDGYLNLLKGANIGGFIKVARAMSAQGVV